MPITINLAEGLEERLREMPEAERKAMLLVVLENLNRALMAELDPPGQKHIVRRLSYKHTVADPSRMPSPGFAKAAREAREARGDHRTSEQIVKDLRRQPEGPAEDATEKGRLAAG